MTVTTLGLSPSDDLRCGVATVNGGLCQAYRQLGKQTCFMHDPDQAVARAAAQRAGGLARHGRYLPPASSMPELPDHLDANATLQHAASTVWFLEPSLGKTRALTALASTITTVIVSQELQERIAKLEEATGLNDATY